MEPEKSMVPQPNIVLEQSLVPEPEDIPIPDADDLVIAILTDQLIDFDENDKDALEIYVVIG